MLIHLIAVGTRMPAWVEEGFNEYAKRMPPESKIKLVEIPAGKRGKNSDIKRLTEQEGKKMLAAIPKSSRIVVLDVLGKSCSTEDLAQELKTWQASGQDIALLIGGPEGLAPECLKSADQKISLSKLTLPHPLVRVVLAEQLYRASTILKGHPYHKS
ncbi:MAG: 23S rRNA (pseudouridine(1915)-N(3))-methyltransferase RlmH [Woeseiaceae bacterium]